MDIFGQYWHFSILGGMKIQLNIFIVSNTDFLSNKIAAERLWYHNKLIQLNLLSRL